jgi:hypothetical protein
MIDLGSAKNNKIIIPNSFKARKIMSEIEETNSISAG